MSQATKTSWCNPEPEIHRALALWAAACARRTLHLFEATSPSDARPRLALEALYAWVQGERSMVACRKAAFAAHTAAREATHPAAIAAARATGQAAAVAHMWNHAPHAATYAAKAAALAAPPEQTETARLAEREWQWEHLREELRFLGFPKGK